MPFRSQSIASKPAMFWLHRVEGLTHKPRADHQYQTGKAPDVLAAEISIPFKPG
jgi:hypothetical protein